MAELAHFRDEEFLDLAGVANRALPASREFEYGLESFHHGGLPAQCLQEAFFAFFRARCLVGLIHRPGNLIRPPERYML